MSSTDRRPEQRAPVHRALALLVLRPLSVPVKRQSGMASGYEGVIDGLILTGLLSFPLYSVYWFGYHFRGTRRHRLWVGIVALLVWCAATYFCFLRLLLGCLGGHCEGKVSPFLELAVVYAVSSAILILLMHWYRAQCAG